MKYCLICLAIVFISILNVYPQNKKTDDIDKSKDKMVSGTFGGLKPRLMGPAITSGRIGDIVVHPKDKSTWYIVVSSGNVWKTTNSGISFSPIFDNYGSYSVGCVTIDPNNPHTVWVGSGENNSQRSVGYGDGIYKSTNDGESFENVGLKKSEHIAKIIVDPKNSDIVYVAAQGPLWGAGGERGLYKTSDGGKTWEKSLFISDNTGVTDVVMDPRDNNVLYAASYQRRRHVWTLINGGPEGAIYKSTDAGKSWNKIMNGLPSGDIGRIGLAISPQKPDYVYAVVELPESKGEFYRTSNRGASWSKMSNVNSASAQYYSEIVCDPIEFDKIYSLDTYTKVTNDGGSTWKNVGLKERHVDDHAIWIDPDNNKHFIIGGDGGMYETYDEGSTYRFFENLPVTQFYRIQADNALPFYNVYGGTQDNNSLGAPARTTHYAGILNQDWIYLVGGDGYEPQIDPTNPDIIYCQWQYGNLNRFDKKSGELTGIQPQTEKGEEIRWNWDTPVIISPHSNTRLYIAANKVFKSDDRGNSWKKVSEDLTRQIDRDKLKVMDKIWNPETVAKNQSTSLFGNIISLTESPVKEDLLYIGTDDGLIQVMESEGKWTKYDKFAGVPESTYVSDIYASRHSENVVYATFNNYKSNDFKPYILKSNDKGKSWTSIASNLPENSPVWTIEEDTKNPDLLFVGTEFGLYFTVDGGKKWIQIKSGFPTIAVRDLDIQEREGDLAIGTFGRGIYILDDYSALREIKEELFSKEAHVFKVKDALLYMETSAKSRSCEGETFYKAENPPYGATFTYYLKDAYKTNKQIRKDKEKEDEKANKTIYYPNLEELRTEDLEEAPYLVFVINDNTNTAIRYLKAANSSGVQRINWDLKYGSTEPVGKETNPNKHSGVPVPPGKYSVTMYKVLDGIYTKITEPAQFEVNYLNNVTFQTNNLAELTTFHKQIWKLQGAISSAQKNLSEFKDKLASFKNAFKVTEGTTTDLFNQIKNAATKLDIIDKKLNGDASIAKRAANQPMSLSERLQYITWTMGSTTSAPTNTNKESYKIAEQQFNEVFNEMQSLKDININPLEKKLDELNAPYTPGRFPNWKK